MAYFFYFLLFILGLVVGSFLNVIALRYEPDQKLLSRKTIGGRSHCPICHKKLVWYELIPIFSFLLQKCKCRNCGNKISLQYPLIEILSGFIFVSVPWYLNNFYQISHLILLGGSIDWYYLLSIIWIFIFSLLLLLSIIDFRYSIIPNQINLSLAILGFILIAVISYYDKFSFSSGSFLKNYAVVFGLEENIWLNHFFAAVLGMIILGTIILLSRGKAMGLGDFKLVGALGLIFGWPDILIVLFLAFIIGALLSIILLVRKKKKMKDMVPFGPFLVIGVFLTFFFGYQIINGYFQLFGLY